MKLSKQERIAAIVVIILIILVAGVFIFIKPNIETINETRVTLDEKKAEYEADVEKAATKDPLRTQILDAYNNGKNMADMFFPELKSYEADNEIRALLAKIKENGNANVLVEDLTVSAPGTAGLSSSVYVPPQVQYALKDYVNQGGSAALAQIDPNTVRQALIQLSLGQPQTIGGSTVNFTLIAPSIEDLLAFADEINSYEKEENGKTIRKAIKMSGVSFTDSWTDDEYTQLASEFGEEDRKAGGELFEKNKDNNHNRTANADADAPGEGEGGGSTPPASSDEVEDRLDYHVFRVPCTITFYSIERMQDPTDQLNEQDKAA
ncbi:MAG: hypothetical protein K2J80_13865 [Oscillospiraceae bacterium]|nr:hypothetical protein [Oscillospiraceae bacterium]